MSQWTMGGVTKTRQTPPRLLTLRETAALLRLSEHGARLLAAKGQLPGARKLGGQWRFSRATLERAFDLDGGREPGL